MTRPHRPDLVTFQRPDGRYVATCLTCSESSRPSLHKPAVSDWAKAHRREALGGGSK